MSIEIRCNQCGKRMRAPDNAIGKKARCQCGNLVPVVDDSTQKTVVSPPPSESGKLAETSLYSDSSHVSDDLQEKTIGGYRILNKLGQGGMGAVWKAHDENLKRDVAIKTLTSDTFATESSYQRFLQEAQSAAKLFSKHTVTVLAAGRDGHIPYMVMEFVEGESVGDILDHSRQIAVPQALDYIRQAARGLADAQEYGIIHRDIKPDNLMVSRKGVVKVADFGLARATSKNDERLTTTGQILGTPVYMSPEQAEGHDVDFRSDIYSIGATLYHMLSGERPFKGESSLRVLMNVVEKPPADLALYLPDIPPRVKSLVEKMMEKNPDARFQSYEELIREIDATIAESTMNHSVETVAAPAVKKQQSSAARTESIYEAEPVERPVRTKNIPARPPSKKKLYLALAAAIFILLNVGIALVLTLKNENKIDASANSQTAQKTEAPASPPTSAPEKSPVTATPKKVVAPSTVKHAPGSFANWTPSREQIAAAEKLGVPVQYDEDLGGGVILHLTLVPPGNFQMGFEPKPKYKREDVHPPHMVVIKNAFYIGAFELTVQQINAIMGVPMSPADETNNLPVINMSWTASKNIVRKINEKFGEENYRLPSESEWEYACLASSIASEPDREWPDNYVWYDRNSENKIHPVGEKKPNAWGIFDMLGNVYEFCEDDYHSNYVNAPSDHQPWFDRPRGDLRVLRGGSFLDNEQACRAAVRGKEQPNVRRQQYGLRLVRSIENLKLDAAPPVQLSAEQLKAAADASVEPLIEISLDAESKIKMKMIIIPAGEFLMGSSKDDKNAPSNGMEFPQHRVTIKQPFYIGVYECTQAQWKAVMGDSIKSIITGENNPMEHIHGYDAAAFAEKLNVKTGKSVFRLPSEAEWEYACRAASSTRFYYGDDNSFSWLDKYAVHNANSSHRPVGQKLPNNWGLYDMLGNVWEICEDDLHPNYKGAPDDGSVWTDSPRAKSRITRGGSFLEKPAFCRSASRNIEIPDSNTGFRLAMSIEKQAASEIKQPPVPGLFVRKRFLERRRPGFIIPEPDADVTAPTRENTEAEKLLNKLQISDAEKFVHTNSRRIYAGKKLLEVILQASDIIEKINAGDSKSLDEAEESINSLDSEAGKPYDGAVTALRQKLDAARKKLKQ